VALWLFIRRENVFLCGLETVMRAEKLTLDDVRALADAFANNTTLTRLDISCTESVMHWRRHQRAAWMMAFLLYELLWTDNRLGMEGAKVIAKALESNPTLTTLDLRCTDSVMHWRRH
jgi:hypothetical protein